MKIIYQDREILIEPKKIKTTVRNLLKYIRPKLSLSSEEEIFLLEKKSEEKHSCLDEYTEIDLEIENGAEFILISFQNIQQNSEKIKTDPIEKQIMQVTNAKEQILPLKAQKKKRLTPEDNNLEYLEQILSGGNYNFSLSSVRLRNEIANLMNNPFMAESSLPNSIPNYNFDNNLGSNVNINSNNAFVSNIINTNINNQTNVNVSVGNNNPIIPNNNNVNVRIRPPSIEANPAYVLNLIDMGFAEDRAKKALIASKNNLNHATEMILNGYDLELNENSNPSYANCKYLCNFLVNFNPVYNIQSTENVNNNNQNTNENINSQE